ncbi:MAG: hypothetical protein AVO34_14605 [Firmicutes bacterium ML8_F2]|jgi:translation initiation factor IF-3|nr:MAG: hypothetical protein AVO34_14605 [Firmicutes bacterium ML8_F2]
MKYLMKTTQVWINTGVKSKFVCKKSGRAQAKVELGTTSLSRFWLVPELPLPGQSALPQFMEI